MSRKNIRIKPGRGQSAVAFFIGIIMCAIGAFMVVPAFGFFGVLWLAIAVVITAMNGINLFSPKGISSGEIIIEENGSSTETNASRMSVESRLKAAEELYQRGVITREEYEQKRGDILKDL